MPNKIATIAIAMAISTSAIAADKETVLNNLQMPVMVNQGSSYVEATDSMFLYAGDRVMVLEGGSAQLNYANGCVQVLGANEVAQIDNTADTCNSMAAAGTHQALGGSSSGGAGAGTSSAALITASVVGIGAAAVIIDNSRDDDDKQRPPASP